MNTKHISLLLINYLISKYGEGKPLEEVDKPIQQVFNPTIPTRFTKNTTKPRDDDRRLPNIE